MMRYYTLICACFFTLQVSAQRAGWDSSYRPGLYHFKVALYDSFPGSPDDIIFLGNSLTDRVDWNELLETCHARNRGISGDITFGVLQRLSDITKGQPAKIFILIGINDISRNIPDSLIVLNYRTMISRIRSESPGTKVYLQTLMPVNNTFTQFKNHYNKDEHILWINQQIKQIGKDMQVEIIDLYPHFLDARNKLDKAFTEDGLHLNAAGYQVWKKILIPFLK